MRNIVILTGAGISAESGLQTFRAADGLWCGHCIEDVATPEAYLRNPNLVNEFYNARRAQLRDVKPNAAHYALAKLAKEWAIKESGNVLLSPKMLTICMTVPNVKWGLVPCISPKYFTYMVNC